MPTPLFPKEIIEFSAEQHFAENSTRSRVIYISVLLFIVGAFVALPFIMVDVSVQSSGLIRPNADINKITAPVSGNVLSLSMVNNTPVKEGQELFVVASPILDEQLIYHHKRKEELLKMKADLKLLIKEFHETKRENIPSFQTALYRQSYLQAKQQLAELNNTLTKEKREFDRNRQLYEAKVIAQAEFENNQYEFKQAATALKLVVEQQNNKWQTDLLRYQKELEELKGKVQQLIKEKEKYVIKAPMSGSIQNLSGIYPGSYVSANQPIAEISPDTSLIVESYISPKDIGYLYPGIPARFQIDAFNYNQWGTVSGKITEISNDIQVVENQPVFKIKCALDKKFLRLENGYQGNLKKGMTVRGRFLITERSLFQLLHDQVNDWLNPTRNNNAFAIN